MSPERSTAAGPLERLAALEHEQWVTWAQTLLATEPGISPERRARWAALFVPYADLPEAMKEHDRVWARKVEAEARAPLVEALHWEGNHRHQVHLKRLLHDRYTALWEQHKLALAALREAIEDLDSTIEIVEGLCGCEAPEQFGWDHHSVRCGIWAAGKEAERRRASALVNVRTLAQRARFSLYGPLLTTATPADAGTAQGSPDTAKHGDGSAGLAKAPTGDPDFDGDMA